MPQAAQGTSKRSWPSQQTSPILESRLNNCVSHVPDGSSHAKEALPGRLMSSFLSVSATATAQLCRVRPAHRHVTKIWLAPLLQTHLRSCIAIHRHSHGTAASAARRRGPGRSVRWRGVVRLPRQDHLHTAA